MDVETSLERHFTMDDELALLARAQSWFRCEVSVMKTSKGSRINLQEEVSIELRYRR
jgi:hypothetical protein